ncbi:hypothetical protein RB653_007181 [Dictyostelium firmibasis]|uniref:Transcription initiation factor TFIID subunit 10 n=1 Tax=Dictyostelium firmibasis TaxID=79012 RepID=A0AAN7TV02_9MYCE
MENEPIDYEEFINSLEDYVPTIPDEVVTYYLNKTGFSCTDHRIKRLISLATQKFISDVASDSLQFCKIRLQGTSREKTRKDKALVLTTDDLSQALREYGINIRKPEYFAENIPPQEIDEAAAATNAAALAAATATTTTTTTTPSKESKESTTSITSTAPTTPKEDSGESSKKKQKTK